MAIAQPLQDEVNHLAKFWGIARWSFGSSAWNKAIANKIRIMSYCINPNCPIRENPDNIEFCLACGNSLQINRQYWLVRPLRDLHRSPYLEVFEACDRESKTPKVLKSLKCNQTKYKQLFEQEAKILIELDRPGIPKSRPREFFTIELHNGQRMPCLVMDFVEGEDLEKWVQNQGVITQKLALEWLKQLTEILAYVHQHNFFHRDIKPSNIMRKPDGQLVLIDFGTAREVTTTVVEGKEVTAVYSHGYTAPEQIEGKAVPQSDFYALGCTFVYLLTGQPPQAEDLHWRDRVPNLSKAPISDLIEELMASKVENRPQNAQIILQRLEQIERLLSPSNIDDFPVTELPLTPATSRRPWLAIATGLTLSGILIGVWIGRNLDTWFKPIVSRSLPCALPAQDISAIAFSPNGKFLVTASLDKTVRVLAINGTNTQEVGCQAHKDSAVTIAFSPNGKKFATASLDATAGLGTLDSNGSFRSFTRLQPPNKSFPVVAIAFSPDGKYLATATADGTVQVWDVDNAQAIAFLKQKTYIRGISFSKEGKYLAIASLNDKARIWSWQAHSYDQKTQFLPTENVIDVAYSPTEPQYLVSASTHGLVQVWDTNNYKEVARLKDKAYIMDISFSPEGKYLATVNLNNEARVWEWKKYRNGQNVALWLKDVAIAAFSAKDGKYLAAVSSDGTAQIWKTGGGDVTQPLTDVNRLAAVAFSPRDENYLATASTDGSVTIQRWR